MTGHRTITKKIPPKKLTIPRKRSRREKNRTVLEKPVCMSENSENE